MSKLQPYPYQAEVGKLLLAGKNVILQAPTGAGKTTAALLPYLHARKHLDPTAFPRKCIYSVPMRILATQFKEEYQKVIRRYGWQDDLRVTIQTGDQPDDPNFEGDLIFTTVDQTLSGFLNIPYGLGTASANLNAGAVLSSYLVFDELHLFDPDTMLPTTLELLRMVRKVTPFVIMTATFSSAMLQQLATLLDAVVVPADAETRKGMEQIGSQIGKTRRIFTVDAPLTAEQVLTTSATAKRIICICNTVGRAQSLYRAMTTLLDKQGDTTTQVRLLHSRFYKEHRNQKEDWARTQFGVAQNEYSGTRLILIATQVIEVGLDVTCDALHTEVAPASAILQRTGRCARRAHETGNVYIYLPRDAEGNPDYTPYYLKSQSQKTEYGRRLCEATWVALAGSDFQGVVMNFSQEQKLIDQVHTPIDQEILSQLADSRQPHQNKMLLTMQNQEHGLGPELIRNINNRFVIIHPDPSQDEQLRHNPWHYDGFALYPGSLAQAFTLMEQAATGDIPWIMYWAHHLEEKPGKAYEEKPSRQKPEWRWVQMRQSNEAFQTAILAVHPTIARYDADVGFEFALNAGTYELHRRTGKSAQGGYSYQKETFAEHVTGLYRAYRYGVPTVPRGGFYLPLADEIAHATKRMESDSAWGLTTGMIDILCRALFAGHDLGKLDVKWQDWAHKWQKQVGVFYGGQDLSLPADYMAAHTDYDPTPEQKAAQKRMIKRPHHAGESAMAAGNLLFIVTGGNRAACRAALTAIARHHHAATDSYQPFKLHKAAKLAVREALQAVNLPVNLSEEILWQMDDSDALQLYIIDFDTRSTATVLLYLLLVRVLRLADQRSQQH